MTVTPLILDIAVKKYSIEQFDNECGELTVTFNIYGAAYANLLPEKYTELLRRVQTVADEMSREVNG